jgi:hypothetical protein
MPSLPCAWDHAAKLQSTTQAQHHALKRQGRRFRGRQVAAPAGGAQTPSRHDHQQRHPCRRLLLVGTARGAPLAEQGAACSHGQTEQGADTLSNLRQLGAICDCEMLIGCLALLDWYIKGLAACAMSAPMASKPRSAVAPPPVATCRLRDDARKSPEVISYLQAENNYTNAVMASTKGLQVGCLDGKLQPPLELYAACSRVLATTTNPRLLGQWPRVTDLCSPGRAGGCAHNYACARAHTHTHTHTQNTHARTHARTHEHTQTHTHTHTHAHTRVRPHSTSHVLVYQHNHTHSQGQWFQYQSFLE